MFDVTEIYVKGGDGGDGVVSFRREKFVPFGGPDGGDGGNGGSVFILGDGSMSTLSWFRRRRHFKAADGGKGRGRKMHGRNGDHLVIRVPVGTVVSLKGEGGQRLFLADVDEEGKRVMVARGARGGFGNARFATATRRAPRIALKGERGEEATFILDLKVIADVGIVGYPNVGKSTLLASASAARPKIADYPFTTREPALGMVDVGNRSFVLAEIPGLIQGAHRGLGLGQDFLRHTERTRVLIHLLDGTSSSALSDMKDVDEELCLFNPVLAEKAQIVAVNKIDLPEVEARIEHLKQEFASMEKPLCFVSAATGRGVPQLMAAALEMLDRVRAEQPREQLAVFRPEPKVERISISKQGEVFVVSAPRAERLIARIDLQNPEALAYLRGQFARMGLSAALKRAGAKPGDRVFIGQIEMEWE